MNRAEAVLACMAMNHSMAPLPDINDPDLDGFGIWLWGDPEMAEEIALGQQNYCILENGLALWPKDLTSA